MKRKPPQLSLSLSLSKVFAKVLERIPLRGMLLKGNSPKGNRLLLPFVLFALLGGGLFLLKGALMRQTGLEVRSLPPPPPQQTVAEPPTIAVSPPQPPSSANPPRAISPPTPPVPQSPRSQMSGPSQQGSPELTSPPKKEIPKAPKVPRDPFLYPQKTDEKPPRISASSPSSPSPSSLPPPPLPNPSSSEKLPSPPSSLPPLPPPPDQNASSQSQKTSAPLQPTVVGVAFGEKALAVLSIPGEGEVPLFVGEVYKGWKITGIERRPNVVLVRVKTPNGKEILLKYY